MAISIGNALHAIPPTHAIPCITVTTRALDAHRSCAINTHRIHRISCATDTHRSCATDTHHISYAEDSRTWVRHF